VGGYVRKRKAGGPVIFSITGPPVAYIVVLVFIKCRERLRRISTSIYLL
jgi:hypothetical protein